MSRQTQVEDSKPQPPQNDDVPDDDSSPVPQDQPQDQEKIRKRDYIDLPSHPYIMKILNKQVYIVDPETDSLKRRIALAAVEKICLSELSDNFLAVIVPTEYDLLIASARKNEIITAFVEAYELDVVPSNRFQYNAASDLVKEIEFEEVEGGVKTRILRK